MRVSRWFSATVGRSAAMRLRIRCSTLASRGYRCIAHDRRGHGRSSQPWNGNDMDTYADDLAALVKALGLKNAIHVGHSTGGAEITHYIGRHGTKRVAKTILIGSVTPLMVKTDANPAGTPIKAFDDLVPPSSQTAYSSSRTSSSPFTVIIALARRPPKECGNPFGYKGCWLERRRPIFCIKAFSETDFTEDLKAFDVPTLILHGDDDQIVPIQRLARSRRKSSNTRNLRSTRGAHTECARRKRKGQRRPPRIYPKLKLQKRVTTANNCGTGLLL